MAKRSFSERLRNLDRRLIFLLIALAVVIPLLLDVSVPEEPTAMVIGIYDALHALGPGSRVLIDFTYDPASMPEVQPMADAVMRQCLLQGHKIYLTALWPVGQQLAEDTLRDGVEFVKKLDPERRLTYGVDYVNLGYKSGYQGVIKVLQTNFAKMYPTDAKNNNIGDIPMMKSVNSLRDIDMIVSISSGWPGTKEWIQFGSDPVGKPCISGSTAVQTPLFYPYYPRQMLGVMGGIKGAAEYEVLVYRNVLRDLFRKRLAQLRQLDPEHAAHLSAEEHRRLTVLKKTDLENIDDRRLVELAGQWFGYTQRGISRMGPQAMAHLVIILLIVIGNVAYFLDRRRVKR